MRARVCSNTSRQRPRESSSDHRNQAWAGCRYDGNMSGVTWEQRQPTDWLASNGRWFPASKYPRGWSRSALPPAPDHGGVGSILRAYAGTAASPASNPKPSTPTPNGPGNSESRSASHAVVRTGRGVADATVTAQRTYAPPVSAGAPPPPALATSADIPAPPGRIRDEQASSDADPRPSAPTKVNTPYIPPPSGTAATAASGSFEVVAGDLGSVLGSARKRIAKAINDSATS